MPSKTAASNKPSPKPRRKKASGGKTARSRARTQNPVPRAAAAAEDEDLFATGQPSHHGFGRCGGRLLGSALEQRVCDRLGALGITHSHSPRHFEVRLDEKTVAAYAPMIVLRGRGREGKTVVIETSEVADSPILDKVKAFRSQYGAEFYLIFVAPEEVLDEISISLYDEASSTQDLNTLVSRLAE